MTPEQKAAYVIAMSAAAMIEAMGMRALNEARADHGYAQAYNEDAFSSLIEKYGLHPDALMHTFDPRT